MALQCHDYCDIKFVVTNKRLIKVFHIGNYSCDQPHVMFYLSSPSTLTTGLTVADTVEACIIDTESAKSLMKQSASTLSIKVQGKHGQRDSLTIQIQPTQPLGMTLTALYCCRLSHVPGSFNHVVETLMREFATIKGVSYDNLVFHFDGETICPTDTPTDLDLEDGYCIDVSGY